MDSVLRLQDVPPELLKQIKAELTLENPEYKRRRMFRLPIYKDRKTGEEVPSPTIKLFSEKMVNGSIEYLLPRGYFPHLWNLAGLSWSTIDDKRVKLPEISFSLSPQLRDYQAPAVKLAKDWQQGVFIAPCGSGKTVCGIGMIVEVRQPALWITHTMDLLKQSKDSAVKFLGLNGSQIGVIQGENMSIGTHVTFATVQTLNKRDLSDIRNRFGCVVIDEAHLVFKDAEKARIFESVISQFPAFYRFGLTASEHRSDGLIETMFHVIGPKFYEVEQGDPRLSVIVPRVEFIETDFGYDQGVDEDGEKEMLSVQQMYVAMRCCEKRNDIIKEILGSMVQGVDYCLCLGDSLSHLKEMCDYVKDFYGAPAAFVCGETPKKEREAIMSGMRKGRYAFLFTTKQLSKLGLDIPRLNKLVLLTPHKDPTTTQQGTGRLMRPFEGKGVPVVYDIWDNKVPQCKAWARERAKVYRDLGCVIKGGPKIRNK
jgi:superfamily II DNA or RNA helicase